MGRVASNQRHRNRAPEPGTGTGHRNRAPEPPHHCGHRNRAPEPGPVPVPGSGARNGAVVPVPGSGARFRCPVPVPGSGAFGLMPLAPFTTEGWFRCPVPLPFSVLRNRGWFRLPPPGSVRARQWRTIELTSEFHFAGCEHERNARRNARRGTYDRGMAGGRGRQERTTGNARRGHGRREGRRAR